MGLLRFPDVYTRLHALTKADKLVLGFMVAGLPLLSLFFILLATAGGGS